MSCCGDSQVQETFLTPSVDNQTRYHGTEWSNYYRSPINMKVKGIEP